MYVLGEASLDQTVILFLAEFGLHNMKFGLLIAMEMFWQRKLKSLALEKFSMASKYRSQIKSLGWARWSCPMVSANSYQGISASNDRRHRDR